MNQRAITYRRLHDIPESWGTAVNVQAMVFGNMGETSATGVAFTRNPSTGEKALYGEFLVNAQGEDVVAGIRTPQDLTEAARIALRLRQAVAGSGDAGRLRRVLEDLRARSRSHYRDMQDLEFTIERRQAVDAADPLRQAHGAGRAEDRRRHGDEGLITEEEAVLRIDPASLDQLLHPTIDPTAERDLIATGLPASPGAASGEIVFSPEEAETLKDAGRKVILVRVETSPEDIHGMHAAEGILTTPRRHDQPRRRGGARHGQALRVGRRRRARRLHGRRRMTAGQRVLKKGDVITIDGSTGQVLAGAVAMQQPELSGDFQQADGMGRRARGGCRCAPMPRRRPTRARRAPSAPRASAFAAPSTCSSTTTASSPCAR